MKLKKIEMQAAPVKDVSARSQRNALLHLPRILENKDQEYNVYELGFTVVDQLVSPEHSVSSSSMLTYT
jgi:hypothetical protein